MNRVLAVFVFVFVFVAGLCLLSGCDDTGSAGHGHAHGPGAHGDEHAGHGGHGHDHGDGRPKHVVTKFGEGYELFVEFPTLAQSRSSEFVAHFTRLDDYRPVDSGNVSVVLTSQDSPGERWQADEPARPGIFTPAARPRYAGDRQLILVLETEDGTHRFDLGRITVHEDLDAARDASVDEPGGDIEFLKETQWRVDFGVVRARTDTVGPSVVVGGRIRPASDAEAYVTAPFTGRVRATREGLPEVGDTVDSGDVVARVVPRLDAGEISRLRAQVRQAELTVDRARREVARIGGLTEQGALPKMRLTEAEHRLAMAKADAEQTRARMKQYRSMEASRGGSETVAVRSPIDGVVARRSTVDGAYVESGATLFHVVDRTRLWLEARIPEAQLDAIDRPTGVWFDAPGGDAIIEVDADPDDERLISFGEVVDPRTRTVPLIFALPPTPEALRIGAYVSAHVLSGEPRQATTVPASAILEERGVEAVYVMESGESFRRAIVRTGIRDRGRVEILEGLEPGTRVVSPGAYFVKLAAASTGSVGHGHTH